MPNAMDTSDAKFPSSKRAGRRSEDHMPIAGCSWGRAWEGIAGLHCARNWQMGYTNPECVNGV